MIRPCPRIALVLFLFWTALLLGCSHAGGGALGTRIAERAGAVAIAVVPFGLASGTPPPPVDVADVIRRDLAASGQAFLLDADGLPARPARLSEVDFDQWRDSPADYLVIGLVAGVHDGGHEVEFRLLDPRSESRERATLIGYVVASAPDELEATAHRIASMIADRLAAKPGGPFLP